MADKGQTDLQRMCVRAVHKAVPLWVLQEHFNEC